MADREPRVSVTVAVWNGMRWLPGLIDSLEAQTVEDFELVVVDDASTDGSSDYLSERLLSIRAAYLVVLPRNRGYIHAQNLAIGRSRGEAVLALNQDVVLDERYLETVSKVLRDRPMVGSVQARILRLGVCSERTDIVDTTGLLMRRDRRVVSRDQGRRRADLARPSGVVWGTDGPASLYRRSALLDVRQPDLSGGWEVFDSDFGMQKEDADLAWRLRRAGWEAWYEPAAVAWHARTGADTARSGITEGLRDNMRNSLDTRVMAWRNQRLMQLKNDDFGAMLPDLPWIARRELGMLAWIALRDQRRLRAVPGFLRLAPRALRRRRAVARARRTRGEAT